MLNVLITFLRLGLTSFGGPVAHIGYFRRELVERQRWVTEAQFAQYLALCQFLPGPASSQLGFLLGMHRAGFAGALCAFIAFTLPSVLLLLLFASSVATLSGPIGQAAIAGLKLVACVVVADALWAMWRALCPDTPSRLIALLSLLVMLTLQSPATQLIVIAGGALAGVALIRRDNSQHIVPGLARIPARLSWLLFIVFGLLLVLASLWPMVTPTSTAVFAAFYQAGALVFGGGHVVLPLLQESVVTTGWLSETDFLAGYGAAQAIPGPMFAFSAYLGTLVAPASGQIGFALIALLGMFLPGFLLVTAVLPVWQRLHRLAPALRAVSGVNAAVVGILAAAWYNPVLLHGLHSVSDGLIALLAFALLRLKKLPVLMVVGLCVALRIGVTVMAG